MKKMLVIAAANNFNFILDIARCLEKSGMDIKCYPFYREGSNMGVHLSDTDTVWLEWADGICLQLLLDKQFYAPKYLRKKRVILRIHRYELFNQNTIEAISNIDHTIIDHLVFVSDYVRQIGISHFPWMEKGVVIPNLIDIDKFPFYERTNTKKLLFLGRISYVKNLPLMLNMFYELIQVDPEYELHLVGNIHEKELIYYLDNFLNKTKLHGKIIIHGHVENDKLPELMKGMSHICNASIFESQGVGILEGMATGLRPVVFNFPGAEDFFPGRYLYINRKEFFHRVASEGIDGIEPRHFRGFVMDNYSIQKKIGLYEDLIDD